MNYRHAFHAGNHADVLKHLILVYGLAHLGRKAAPFAVLDTHAGAGLYDLDSEEARRSPEWADGVGRLRDWRDAPPLIAAYLEAVAAFAHAGANLYPGSPSLIASALRDADVLMACELHPEEASALRRRFAAAGNVQVHGRDGWEALNALLPPAAPRGLVLIDPPYEEPGELERGARDIAAALKRFAHGVFLWWRPMKDEAALARADNEIRAHGARALLRADLWVDTPRREGKLTGSSVLIINPPYGLAEGLAEALPPLAAKLSQGAHGWRLG